MNGVVEVKLTPDRRMDLLEASSRLHKRLAFAREGIPAWSYVGLYGEAGGEPFVKFAPPWAEDPDTLLMGLDRIAACLENDTEFAEAL